LGLKLKAAFYNFFE